MQTLAEVAGSLNIEPNQLLSCYLVSSPQMLVLITKRLIQLNCLVTDFDVFLTKSEINFWRRVTKQVTMPAYKTSFKFAVSLEIESK